MCCCLIPSVNNSARIWCFPLLLQGEEIFILSRVVSAEEIFLPAANIFVKYVGMRNAAWLREWEGGGEGEVELLPRDLICSGNNSSLYISVCLSSQKSEIWAIIIKIVEQARDCTSNDWGSEHMNLILYRLVMHVFVTVHCYLRELKETRLLIFACQWPRGGKGIWLY